MNNLRAIRKSRGLNQRKLAEISGLSPATINSIEKNKRSFSQKSIEKICKVLNCTIGQMIGKEKIGNFFVDISDQKLEQIKQIEQPEPKAPLVMIKKYDVQASAGDGMMIYGEEITDEISFSLAFLRRISSSKPEFLAFISVKGDSMYPTFRDGDTIMVDKNKTDVEESGVYVIRIGNLLKIKRIRFDPFRKSLKIISDNKVEINGERLYQDYEISTEVQDDLDIIGKVVWAAWSLR